MSNTPFNKPRPNTLPELKSWVKQKFPGDPTAQQRALKGGMDAIDQAAKSAQRHMNEMARRQANLKKARGVK